MIHIGFYAGVTLKGKDTLTVLNYQNKLTVFSRSVTKASRLYWTQEVNGNWTAWALIGGSSVSLKSDVAVAYNGFSKVQKEESFQDYYYLSQSTIRLVRPKLQMQAG